MNSLLNRAYGKACRTTSRGLMIVRRPARVAIIGCGGIFSRHSAGYEESGRARLVGVSDLFPQALANTLGCWPSARGYLDFRQML